MKQLSIQQMTLRYTLIVLIVVVGLGVVSIFVATNSLVDRYQADQLESLEIKAKSISHVVQFYQNIVKRIASQQKVSDLILFEDRRVTQAWAREMQKLLPESIGLALFDLDGKVLGNPMQLRLGNACITDMHRFLAKDKMHLPVIHTGVSGLEHFDVVETVYDSASQPVGVLFASFSLDTIQSNLDRIISHNQKLAVLTSDFEVIAESDVLNDNHSFYVKRIPIAGTDWILNATIAKQDVKVLVSAIALSNLTIFLLLSIILYFFSRKLIKHFSLDIQTIRNLLAVVKNNPQITEEYIHSNIQETGDIVKNIQTMASDINQYKKRLVDFSITDELTGLYNLKTFDREIDRVLEKQHQGNVIAIDLEYLNQVNELLGRDSGDKVLAELGKVLKENTNATDLCARTGSDEFVVVLGDIPVEKVNNWFDNVSEKFKLRQQEVLNLPKGMRLCALTGGFTQVTSGDENTEEVLSRAHKALTYAKQNGRGILQNYSMIA